MPCREMDSDQQPRKRGMRMARQEAVEVLLPTMATECMAGRRNRRTNLRRRCPLMGPAPRRLHSQGIGFTRSLKRDLGFVYTSFGHTSSEWTASMDGRRYPWLYLQQSIAILHQACTRRTRCGSNEWIATEPRYIPPIRGAQLPLVW